MLHLVSKDTGVKSSQAEQVIKLLEEGNTVPFIARYRKEQTGSLDEVQIKAVEDRYNYIQQLEQRKEEILRLIDEQGKLTEELTTSINNATVLQRVEDLYRPYKQKRRTKATIAKEKGLEPLATLIMTFPKESVAILAEDFLNEELEVLSVDDALLGARDILAEQFADDAKIREQIRNITRTDGKIVASVKKAELDEKNVFEMYYEYEEPVKKIVPHRILALNRGEKEDILKVALQIPMEKTTNVMKAQWIKSSSSDAVEQIEFGRAHV